MKKMKLSDCQTTWLAQHLIATLKVFYADGNNINAYKQWYKKQYGYFPTEGIGIEGNNYEKIQDTGI